MQDKPTIEIQVVPAETKRQTNEARRIFRVMFSRWIVAVGAVIIVVIILMVIFAPLVAPYNPNKQSLEMRLQQPSREHLLGTDALGRDVLSRVIYGSRISLMVGVLVIGIAS